MAGNLALLVMMEKSVQSKNSHFNTMLIKHNSGMEFIAKILFFSVHESAQTVREVVNVGAQGHVAKSRAGHDLVDAVRSVLDGGTFFPSFARTA